MLDHLGVPVSDFERSKRFYAAALSPLGYELIMEPAPAAGSGGGVSLTSGSARSGQPGPPHRVAADDRALLMPSMRRPSRRVRATTVVLDSPRVP